MSELIDRQAALDALGERPVVWTDDDDYALGERNQYDMDRLAIEALPSAQPVCEDAVSKEAVSSWLKQYGQDVLHGKYKFSLMYIWKKLMDLPSVTPKQPGWIPVTERLPKKDGDYLVTTHSGQIARYIFIGGSSEEYWRRCATAWMPLPTPYREGGQDEAEQ